MPNSSPRSKWTTTRFWSISTRPRRWPRSRPAADTCRRQPAPIDPPAGLRRPVAVLSGAGRFGQRRPLLCGLRRRLGKGGQHFASKPAQALATAGTAARPAAIDQHIADAGGAQPLEPLGDMIGGAVHRTCFIDRARVAGGAVGAAMDGAVGSGGEPQLAQAIGEAALHRLFPLGVAVADKKARVTATRIGSQARPWARVSAL